MKDLVVSGLDEWLWRRLAARARRCERSDEEEARSILVAALTAPDQPGSVVREAAPDNLVVLRVRMPDGSAPGLQRSKLRSPA